MRRKSRPGDAPRLALFCHCLDDHAIARLSLAVCAELAEMGCEISLVVTGVDPVHPPVPAGVRLVDLGLPYGSTIAAVPALAGWLRRDRPDVLFAQHNGPNRAAVMARGLARVRTRVRTRVVTVEQNHYSSYIAPAGGGWKQRRLRDWLTRYLYPRADCVAGVSPEVVEDLEERFPGVRGKTAVLPNPGPSPRAIASLEPPDPDVEWLASPRAWRVVTSVANVLPRKGQDVLVEALPHVRRGAGDVRLLCVGRIDNEEYHAALVRRAQELGVSPWVHFLGFREDRLSLLAASDAFALASRNEGAPLSILEAMACGVPIVATDCPSGPAHLLESGRCGKLAAVDDTAQIADCLVEVLTRPDARDRYVRAARYRAADFTPRRASEAYLALAFACMAGSAVGAHRTVHAAEPYPV